MMSDSFEQWARDHALSFDYDLRRWVLVPRPGEPAIEGWAKRTAAAWAQDFGYPADGSWFCTLEAMLSAAATQHYTDEPDAVLLHVLAPPDQAPSPAIATVMTLPTQGPLEAEVDALALGYRNDPQAARPPVVEEVVLITGEQAFVVSAYERDENASVRMVQHVLWHIHPDMLVSLTMADDDLGRVLQATDDMVALASATRLVEVPRR